jgi:hypothetical protein
MQFSLNECLPISSLFIIASIVLFDMISDIFAEFPADPKFAAFENEWKFKFQKLVYLEQKRRRSRELLKITNARLKKIFK